MEDLLAYAYLTIDKANRDKALDDYKNLKVGKINIVSHEEALKRLKSMKNNLDKLLSKFPKNLMISGSMALACVVDGYKIKPRDIDLYMNENNHKTVCEIDSAIRETFPDVEIILMRTQYTINWFLKDAETCNYPNIQLVLPPARHWSEVFSSYHCDLVCVGYLVGEDKFIYAKGRFDRFIETGTSYGTASFIDAEYEQRVKDAIEKYTNYGFKIEEVQTEDRIVDNQIENSPRYEVKAEYFEDIEKFVIENPHVSIGKYLQNIYSGEIFKDYIETMSIFNRCPTCNELIVGKKICDQCTEEENKKTLFVKKVLQNSDKNLRYLVTGGRCGLGHQISNILAKCNRDVTITTRFPQLIDEKQTIQLDLKDPKSVREFEEQVGNYDVLILSAAETLHYPDVNKLLSSKKEENRDWTNDFHREDTGVWHKCIDEHSNEEIEDPIQINITSITKIIRSFVAYQIKNKPSKQKSIIYVTSSEGLFIDKSPFHPVTNMTKSAIEQLICTMKRQADVLKMNLVMADPGWMYTKSTNGKNIGPITLEWGASQVLLPLATILDGQEVLNGSLWSRKKYNVATTLDSFESNEIVKFKGIGETCPASLDQSNVMILLKPCNHKLGLQGWYQIKNTNHKSKCPICRNHIKSNEIVELDDVMPDDAPKKRNERFEESSILSTKKKCQKLI